MDNKVYVVERGCYSDYSVVGVFSSKKNAQMVADIINAHKSYGDEATVDCWPMNPAVEELNAGMRQFNVTMIKDGTVERCEQTETSGYDLAGSVTMWRRTQAEAYKGKGIPDAMSATVWAKSREHAIKIVNEHRSQWIANGKW